MKIFLSFLQSLERHPIPAYDFWFFYIKNGLAEAGHTISECPNADWAKGLVPLSKPAHQQWKEDIWTNTLRHIRKDPPDLFLCYLYPQQIDMTAIAEIRKMGIPCVNFFCDNVREFITVPAEYNVFDLNWVPEYKALDLYGKAGYPCIHLPMPMWVNPSQRIISSETNQHVTFIGSIDIQRKLLLEKVLELSPSLPLNVYGSGWDTTNANPPAEIPGYTLADKIRFNLNFIKTQGPAAFYRKIQQRQIQTEISAELRRRLHGIPDQNTYSKLIASSMITLGINRYPSFRFPLKAPDAYSRLRDLEAPMIGACYLTEWTEGITELYDIDKEISVYRNEAELLEQIAMLQNSPSKRKMLKENGQRRALSAHSIPVSIDKLRRRLSL